MKVLRGLVAHFFALFHRRINDGLALRAHGSALTVSCEWAKLQMKLPWLRELLDGMNAKSPNLNR